MAIGVFSGHNAATFTGRVQNAVHEVSISKKLNENEKIEGNAELQLLQAALQVSPQAPSSVASGSVIDIKV